MVENLDQSECPQHCPIMSTQKGKKREEGWRKRGTKKYKPNWKDETHVLNLGWGIKMMRHYSCMARLAKAID
jgi:hypothetical protein